MSRGLVLFSMFGLLAGAVAPHAAGQAPAAPRVSAGVNASPPAAVALQVSGTPAADSVSLSWPFTVGVLSYRLERRLSGGGAGDWTVIMSGNSLSHVDRSVTHLTAYEYRLFASNPDGASPPSGIVSVTTPDLPSAPQVIYSLEPGVTVLSELLPGPRVRLYWLDVRYEAGYRIERSVDGTEWLPLGTAPADHSGTYDYIYWTDDAVTPGTSYHYRVIAHNAKGDTTVGTTHAVAHPTPVLIEDDFENPGHDPAVWTTLGDATVLPAGATGNHALRIHGDDDQPPFTRAVDLTLGGRITYRYRHADLQPGPVLMVHVMVGSQSYGSWEPDTTSAPDADGWVTATTDVLARNLPGKCTFTIAPSATVSTPGLVWEIDDLSVTGVMPAAPPSAVTEVMHEENELIGSGYVIWWDASAGASSYLVQRRTASTAWEDAGYSLLGFGGLPPGTHGFVEPLAPGTEYFYRVIASNPAGQAAPSPEKSILTRSAFREWNRQNYGLIPPDAPEAHPLHLTEQGLPNLLHFAFNLPLWDAGWRTVDAAASARLPHLAIHPATGRLRIDYVRRTSSGNPGVDYIVEFSDDASTWTPAGHLVETIPLEAGIERIIWEDDAPAAGTPPSTKRFARVRVTER